MSTPLLVHPGSVFDAPASVSWEHLCGCLGTFLLLIKGISLPYPCHIPVTSRPICGLDKNAKRPLLGELHHGWFSTYYLAFIDDWLLPLDLLPLAHVAPKYHMPSAPYVRPTASNTGIRYCIQPHSRSYPEPGPKHQNHTTNSPSTYHLGKKRLSNLRIQCDHL